MKKLLLFFATLLFGLSNLVAQNVDIEINASSCVDFEVVLTPSSNLTANSLTNVQFTLKWPDVVNLTSINPSYGLTQQGSTVNSNNYNCATYVAVDLVHIAWISGTDYTIMTFSHDLSSSGVGNFTVMLNSDGQASIQTKYYVEVLGSDYTGNIYNNANNVDLGKPDITNPGPQTACDSYTLPTITGTNLTGGEAYYDDSQVNSGNVITGPITTTQTVWIYDATAYGCSDEESFVVTIEYTPVITNPGAQTACDNYTLPTITGTNLTGGEAYYDNSQVNSGNVITGPITSTQTVWIYDATAYGCSDEESFVVTIQYTPVITNPGPQTACDSYTLPTITGTNLTGGQAYYDDSQAGTPSVITGPITSTQTVWIYDATAYGCSDEESFVVTIEYTPAITNPGPQTACDSYTLPTITGTNLTGGQAYYDDSQAGTPSVITGPITSTQTVWIYDATAYGCSDEESFVVTIQYTPVITNPGPQTACDSYTLPTITGTNLTGGQAYYDDSQAGTPSVITGPITSTQTVWIYDATAYGCSDEESFVVTIEYTPVITNPGPQTACDSYTLPTITGTNLTGGQAYYDDSQAGTPSVITGPITSTQTVWIYDATAYGCSDEESFVVTIEYTPVITNPGPQTACDSYTLPTITGTNLTGGQAYYDDSQAGTPSVITGPITSTQTVWIYDATAYGCSDEESFVVTIQYTPVITNPGPQTACESYTLPTITGTNLTGGQAYYDDSQAGTPSVITGPITSTMTVWIYDATAYGCSDEESFVVTIQYTPVITNPGPQTACDSYTLPTITGTNLTGGEAYYDNSQVNSGNVITGPITTTQTVWIYDATAYGCSDEESFVVTVLPPFSGGRLASTTQEISYNTQPADITYTTAPGGGATPQYQWYFMTGSQLAPSGAFVQGSWTAIGSPSTSTPTLNGTTIGNLTTATTFALRVTDVGIQACYDNWVGNAHVVTVSESSALLWLQTHTVLSSVSGTIADLTATFPASIPPVIVAEPYKINSRMTLSGEAIPAGSTISIMITTNEGGPVPYVTNVPIPPSPFWVTDLAGGTAADFDAGYGGRFEIYNITINSAGGNPLELNGEVFVESIISKDNFITNTVLDDISLNWTIAPDEAAALLWLQTHTVLSSVSGTIADLTATFPASIPPVIVAEPYKINSRMTLSGEAIPAGSTISIMITTNEGGPVPYVTNVPIPPSPFWVTDLAGGTAADFDAGYGGRFEIYNITINSAGGNPLELNGEVFVESIISKDNFITNTVLDDISLNWTIAPDEAAALLWLQTHTVLSSVSGTIADLTATFPASIPPVIVAEPYKINSRMTLSGEAIPAGSTISIMITTNEGGPVPYVTNVPIPPSPFWVTDLAGGTAADFDAGYGGRFEIYNITINSAGGNPLELNGEVFVESIISKDNFITNTVLDDISLNWTIAPDEAAALLWLQTHTVLSSVSGTIADLTATFPASIPPVIVAEPYKINSRMTLSGEAIPAGSTISIMITTNEGGPVPYVTNVPIPPSPFWVTDLAGGTAADFDAGYGGRFEIYNITINSAGGNPLELNGEVFVESIISKDNFITNTVLDDISLNWTIAPDEAAALLWLQTHTVLSSVSGTIADLTATFPASIPPVIVAEPYKINSRMTLSGEAIPAGSTISIMITTNEGGPVPYVTNVPIPPSPFWVTDLAGGTAADFDAGYGGRFEIYNITINSAGGNPLELNGEVLVESIIDKDGFGIGTETVLDDISLDWTIAPVPSSLKVWLQGPYNTTSGEMETTLNEEIPLSQPYNVAPWNFDETESVTTMPADAVDWVLVELRETVSGAAYERKAALLYKDGSAAVTFSTIVPEDAYYIVVWHHNHMPVMSASAHTLPVISYDFTLLSNLYGHENTVPNVPAINLGGGIYGMIAGDVTKNGALQYSGPGNDRGAIIAKIVTETGVPDINGFTTNGYWQEDASMNSIVLYLGPGNDRSYIVNNLGPLTGTPYLNSIYTSVVPGVYTGSKEVNNDGPFDIRLVESYQSLAIDLVTNEYLENGLVDNIQFTLAWKAGDTEIAELLNSFTSDFMLAPQGDAYQVDGVMHRVYVSVTPVNLPQEFNEGDQATVMSFVNTSGQSVSGRLWIADDDFTNENNAMYYVSVWGTDFTGTILSLATGLNEIPESGSVSIYPNPVMNGIVNIGLNLEETQDVTITLMDMQGKEIFSNSILVNAGLTVNTIEMKNLQQGIYFIRVKANKLNTIEKLLVKQKN